MSISDPKATALYIAPLNALVNDQLKSFLETIALWVELPDRFANLVEKHDRDFAGGIHAIEHAMIAMYPLRLLADRNDVGGVSTLDHNDLNGNCGIFVY